LLAATLRTSRRWLADPYGTLDAERARRGPTFWLDLALVGRVLVTGDPALIQEITAHPDLEAGSGISALRRVLGEGSLITMDGEAHADRRRLVAPFFRRGLEVLDAATCAATSDALQAVPPGGRISIYDLARRVSLRSIIQFLLAPPPEEASRAERLVDAFLLSFESPWVLFLRPLQIDLGRWSPWGRALRNRERLCALLREHVRAARSGGNTGGTGGGILACIAREAPDLSEDDIVAETLALLLFGHDTGAAALAWAVAHIWRRPEVLARVRAEADSAAKPYLEACLKESLRLSPVVPHLTRVAVRTTRIGGHTVPAGTRVFPCVYLAQRDPDVFPEPAAFQPERFLEGQTYEGSWFPFGLGARTCIGNRFALRQMLLTAATAARCAGLAAEPGWEPRPVRRLVLVVPEGGTRMVVGPHPLAPSPATPHSLPGFLPSPGGGREGDGRGAGGEGALPAEVSP
jgi:cytochrome P450